MELTMDPRWEWKTDVSSAERKGWVMDNLTESMMGVTTVSMMGVTTMRQKEYWRVQATATHLKGKRLEVQLAT